jgi:HK97 family phage prohead protease
MPNTDKKGLKVAYAKGIDAEQRTVTAYVSTFDWDRTDERFAKGAWKLENYKRNPVVMAFHDYNRPPVGKAIHIEEDEKGLLATTVFADTEDGKMMFELFKGGFLSAFSVGFAPKKWIMEPIDAERKGITYQDAELLEYSAVGIPANPGAIIGRDIGDIAKKMLPASVQEVKVGDELKYIVLPELEKVQEITQIFEESLKSIVALAKDAKRNRLPGNQLSLLKSAHGLFAEIITEHEPPPSEEDGVDSALIQTLSESVKGMADFILAQYSDEATKARVKQLVREISKY